MVRLAPGARDLEARTDLLMTRVRVAGALFRILLMPAAGISTLDQLGSNEPGVCVISPFARWLVLWSAAERCGGSPSRGPRRGPGLFGMASTGGLSSIARRCWLGLPWTWWCVPLLAAEDCCGSPSRGSLRGPGLLSMASTYLLVDRDRLVLLLQDFAI